MIKRALILILCAALPASGMAGGWYGHGGGYHGGHHFGGHYRHGGHGGKGEALLAGLVIGGLAGWLISEDRHSRRYAYSSYSYGRYPYYERYRYSGYRPVYREYVPVRVAPRPVVVRENPEFAGESCRMTREYTTTIEIDGRPHEAYGTRCLTAEGSWILGRPRLVPEFD